MSYTAKQIDKMSIEEIESLAETLSNEDKNKWVSNGYDGATYIKLIKKIKSMNEVWRKKISNFIVTNITNGDDSEDLLELIVTLESYLNDLKEIYEEED